MRKLAFLLGLSFVSFAGFAQGFVLFANRVREPETNLLLVEAPVFLFQDPDHGPGPDWSVQLVQLTNAQKIPIAPSAYFYRNGACSACIAERYINSGPISVPGVAPGETATFMVRAWKNSFGSFEAAASGGFFGESLPVTITVGTATNPAPLIGLQSFRVGPFSTNFSTALNITENPISLLLETAAPDFDNPNQLTLEQTIERSANLKDWEPVVSLFSFFSKSVSVHLPDRTARLLFSDAQNPIFLRLRYGLARTLFPGEWDQHAPPRYRFTYRYYENDNSNEKPISFSGTVTVENSRMTSITNVTADGIGSEEAKTLFKTVDQLLGIIEENRNKAYFMTVTYDPVRLFPELIEINPWTSEDGTEWGIRHEVSDWQEVP